MTKKILITGASGMIGKALQPVLAEKGYDLLLASRSEPKDDRHIRWTLEDGFRDEDLSRLEGLDAVIHLAGENVAGLRWTEEKKKAIRDSRVLGTRTVIDAFSKLKQKPKTFIAGSAIGFYGDRGDEEMTESSQAGTNFFADVCREWEAESRRAEDMGIRTILLRTGIVLDKDGGALGTMLLPFKLGVGGVVGSGKQWMSWIALEDEIRAIIYVLANENIRGAVNLTSPNPATNQEFTKTLGDVLYRPTFLPLPEFAVSMIFGEMGDALLLDSTKVLPRRLQDAGFEFTYPTLRSAIQAAVK